jgi:hypothetical protein
MKRELTIILLATALLSLAVGSGAQAARKARPWPDISLSTVPSIVWMANSWAYEINHRSPTYLGDLDKMYISFAFGYGKNSNSLDKLDDEAAGRYGSSFYRAIDYKNSDFRLDMYSNLGKTTYGSLWVVYGKDRNEKNKKPFLESVPSRLNFKTAFAWKPKDHLTLAISGAISNYPSSYIFALQPTAASIIDSQLSLPSRDGENLVGEIDFLYRTKSNMDITVGGIFHRLFEKFDVPEAPLRPDGTPNNYKDTAEVKEYIYSGAPRVSVKKTYPSGSYWRAGGTLYFSLYDYQYAGAGRYDYPSRDLPSYRLQSFETLVPKWKFYADGTKALGGSAALYACLETGRYPNALTRKDTDFVPLRMSLADIVDLSSTSLRVDFTGKLTRIFTGMIGLEVRQFDNGDDKTLLDDRSMFLKLRAGGMTRFYRNLWWSIRVPDFRLYTSKALGSAILFENKSYIEMDILFLGL